MPLSIRIAVNWKFADCWLNSKQIHRQICPPAARPRDRLWGIRIAKDQHAIGATFAAAMRLGWWVRSSPITAVGKRSVVAQPEGQRLCRAAPPERLERRQRTKTSNGETCHG